MVASVKVSRNSHISGPGPEKSGEAEEIIIRLRPIPVSGIPDTVLIPPVSVSSILALIPTPIPQTGQCCVMLTQHIKQKNEATSVCTNTIRRDQCWWVKPPDSFTQFYPG